MTQAQGRPDERRSTPGQTRLPQNRQVDRFQLLLLLAKHDVVQFYLVAPKAGAAPAERVSLTDLITGNDIFSLLVWHLGDMVPTVKVNDTLGFKQPLFYTSSLAGWLVLAFKIIVGFALIGSVLAIVQAQRAKPDKPSDPNPRVVRGADLQGCF